VNASIIKALRSMGACTEARDWAKKQSTYRGAWEKCQNADWMLWLVGRVGKDRKRLTLCACEIARTVLHHVPKGETRPLRAIKMAEAWARGKDGVTPDDVRKVSAPASAYASALFEEVYDADCASDAAFLAADAALSAAYAAYAAATPTYAFASAYGRAATEAAADAASAAARSDTLATCADIVRKHYPAPPVLKKEAKP